MFKQAIHRLLPTAMLSDEEREIRRAIRELQQYSDYELADLGIPRAQIEECVRYGRPEVMQSPTTTGPGLGRMDSELRVTPAARGDVDHQDLAA